MEQDTLGQDNIGPTNIKANGHITEVDQSPAGSNDTVDGSNSTPFIRPTRNSHPAPPRTLTPDQETKYASLLSTVQSWTTLPTSSTSSTTKQPLSDNERLWLTRECLLRYLRASKWNEPHAITRVQATLVWRREFKVESHTADYISEENETGKQVIFGYDNEGRPCLYLNPHRQNTKGREKQMQHLVFMLERCIDLTPPGQETLAILVDFKQSRKGENPSVAQGRQTLSILQNHYPERLGNACVKNVPWLVWGFFKLINPFIDPLTREKMKFDVDLRKVVPPEQLLQVYGGDVDFEYNHSLYWPALNTLADERRKEIMQRWEAAGKKIGESEKYLKGVGEAVGGRGDALEDGKAGSAVM
ncbi:CRAL/TRIO domain protein [Usnea florida]